MSREFIGGVLFGQILSIAIACLWKYLEGKKQTPKVKFRIQRGSLEESMETVREFSTLRELENYLQEDVLVLKYVGKDRRINWDTWYVLNRYGQCIGMTNGELK